MSDKYGEKKKKLNQVEDRDFALREGEQVAAAKTKHPLRKAVFLFLLPDVFHHTSLSF